MCLCFSVGGAPEQAVFLAGGILVGGVLARVHVRTHVAVARAALERLHFFKGKML